jgi:hypothetical protein
LTFPEQTGSALAELPAKGKQLGSSPSSLLSAP